MSVLTEFRQDLVSGDWVLFSTLRGKRFHPKKGEKFYQSKKGCPFEDPEASGQKVVDSYALGSKKNNSKDWWVKVIKNKYPAVQVGVCKPMKKMGPFRTIEARGSHEVVITNDHDRNFGDFSVEELSKVFHVFKDRYKKIADHKETCGKYILIFHNHGKIAGASIYHSHSQIISTPILPPDIVRSVSGSQRFYDEYYKKVHDVLIKWEMKEKKRVIFENEHFIAFCPFVSKVSYEVRIFPKVSNPHFDLAPDGTFNFLAEAVGSVLKKINGALSHPDYNIFIHTAPIVEEGEVHFDFYHWHIEILPKLSIAAGFELGSGVDINVVNPDYAAEELNSVK